MKYRVLVVDDNTTARMGAHALLDATADFVYAGEASSGHEALTAVERIHPDVVLMDVHMDGLRGVETTRRLLARLPTLPIVAWTSSTETDDLLEMMQAGCIGYTLKDLGPSELNKALLLALRGETPVPRQLVPDILKRARPSASPPASVQLTEREKQVLQLLVSGKLAKEVASALGISVKSVESHATSLYQKLGAKNRSQAVALAIQWGLVEGSP